MRTRRYIELLSLAALLLLSRSAAAADKYWSGPGTWDMTRTNWGTSAGGPYDVAQWVAGDNAIFVGAGGTVSLGENISITHLNIATNNYSITNNTLNFAAGGTITNMGMKVWLYCGITGEPDLFANHLNGWSIPGFGDQGLFLSPSSARMVIGTIRRTIDNYMVIEGAATGNTIVAIAKPASGGANYLNQKMRWKGPGEWTVAGECYCGEFFIDGGTLISYGLTQRSGRPISGGTFVVNGRAENIGSGNFDGGVVKGTGVIAVNPLWVEAPATLAPGYPTGTLTVSNACTIDGKLQITVDGEQRSVLAVAPAYSLTISNATLNVVEVRSPATDVIIATYGVGKLIGAFAVTNAPNGWDVDYNYKGGNAIALIPPPSGTVLIIR